MTTAAKTFIAAIATVATVAACAAIGVGLANRTATTTTEIFKLQRVVAGKRSGTMVVVTLPNVVIEGRRTVPANVELAMA